MTSSERFKVHPKIVSETIDGEVIMLNLDRGRYYSLTLSGTDAWNAIGRAASGEEIVDELVARYDGARSEVEQAVHQLLDELRREELILSLPPGAAEPAAPSSDGSPPANGAHGSRPAFQVPVLQVYTDMEDLLLLDPIHEVDESGWPNRPSDQAQSPR
jgi:hypothetical protein